jgi:hypothetical protein
LLTPCDIWSNIRLTLAPIWTACAVRALVVQTAAAGSVLLLVEAAVEKGRPAGCADTVVGRLAAVGTALGRPVVPLIAVPRLAHVAVPEVGGADSAAVQPHAHAVGLCMAPPQRLHGIRSIRQPIDCAPVGKADRSVIVVGDGLVTQRAAAWYRGLL